MTDYKQLINALRTHRGWALNETLDAAADAIESLQSDRMLLRNELCLLCGKYTEAHNGACEGCRWHE